MLGHVISKTGDVIDKAKVDMITNLPPTQSMKYVRPFLSHVGFYRKFIKYFSKIVKPLSLLLAKDVSFDLKLDCLKSFEQLKETLTTTSIIHVPNGVSHLSLCVMHLILSSLQFSDNEVEK